MGEFNFKAAAGFFVLAYMLTFGLGYLILHQTGPLVQYGSVIMGFVWVAMFRLDRGRTISPLMARRNNREAKRARAAREEVKRRRIAEVAADPVRRKYIPQIERGELWPDDRIDYKETPKATACCAHLQPIELAMRLAGLDMDLLAPARVKADCRINETALKQRFTLSDGVQYREWYEPERHWSDNPQAEIACAEHSSAIRVVPPDEAREQTSWFPSPP